MKIKTNVIISILSTRLVCENFSFVHEASEFLLGRSLWTHEFAESKLYEELSAAIFKQHPVFETLKLDEMTNSNWQEVTAKWIEHLGPEYEFEKGTTVRTEDPITSAIRIRNKHRENRTN